MPPSNFKCPYCSAPLRIRNRTLIGKQLACPDCGNRILIASAGPRELSLQKIPSESHSRTASKPTTEIRKKTGRLSRWLSVLQSPVGISWLVAGLLAVMLLLAPWPFGNSDSQERPVLQRTHEELFAKKSAQEKLHAGNDGNHAVGRSAQAKIAKHPNDTDNAVDRKNVFPSPVAAEKPDLLIEADQERKLESIPHRDPVVAKIPPEPIDITAALSQPILKFQQQKAIPLRELLTLVEEMAGVPIRYNSTVSADESKLLGELVSLQLEMTTVGEILRTLLKQVDLDYEIGFHEIRILSAKPNSTEENP